MPYVMLVCSGTGFHLLGHSALSGRGIFLNAVPSTSRGSVLGYWHCTPDGVRECGSPQREHLLRAFKNLLKNT